MTRRGGHANVWPWPLLATREGSRGRRFPSRFRFAPLSKFCTSRFKYCYDANTGVIARVDDRLYGALREISPFEEFPAHPAGGVADVFLDAGDHRLDAINKVGLFRAAQIRATLAHPETVKGCLGGILGRFSRMTLEVTQRRNLRCRYCPYTRGSGAGRAHGNTDMSWETARTAVDYFADHLLTSADPASGLPALSFYGGEPLLVPRLIRQCVDYVLAKIPSVRFSCTTNGTPLTNPTADFIAANDFNLLVSLDGPAEIHDRERRSLGGRGSFDRLWANLNRLLERHPDYYRRSVHFQSTRSGSPRLRTHRRLLSRAPGPFWTGQGSNGTEFGREIGDGGLGVRDGKSIRAVRKEVVKQFDR